MWSCAMFNQYWFICKNGLSNSGRSHVGVKMYNLPHCIVDVLCSHAYFLVSWESSVELWTHLATVQVQLLTVDVWIWFELDLLSVSNNVISRSIILCFGHNKDWSSTRSNFFVSCGASIGFIVRSDLVTHIIDQETVCHLVEQHDWVTESQLTIHWISQRNL